MNLTAIQAALRETGYSGWLFYDHHHRDPIGERILGLDQHPRDFFEETPDAISPPHCAQHPVRAALQGRNPAIGETIEIAASKKLDFSLAKQVKDALAG